LLHAQHLTGLCFNLGGIRQPALFDLQAAPLGQPLILARFQRTEFNRQQTALVTRVDNAQRRADIGE
jgi:hypothetical protein